MEGESSCRPAKCKPHDALRSPMEITLQGTTEGDPTDFIMQVFQGFYQFQSPYSPGAMKKV